MQDILFLFLFGQLTSWVSKGIKPIENYMEFFPLEFYLKSKMIFEHILRGFLKDSQCLII